VIMHTVLLSNLLSIVHIAYIWQISMTVSVSRVLVMAHVWMALTRIRATVTPASLDTCVKQVCFLLRFLKNSNKFICTSVRTWPVSLIRIDYFTNSSRVLYYVIYMEYTNN